MPFQSSAVVQPLSQVRYAESLVPALSPSFTLITVAM